MQRVRPGQHKIWNCRIKVLAIFIDHLVAATHGANRCLQYCAAGVLVAFARFDKRLFTNHTFAFHFLGLAVAVGNNPMASQQLRCGISLIGDCDGIGENEFIVFRV